MLINWDPYTAVLDMGALRVDPIRSLGLLSPNYAGLASPRVRTILMHYDQIPKEHQWKVGMAAGR